jgi:hypothetical protein
MQVPQRRSHHAAGLSEEKLVPERQIAFAGFGSRCTDIALDIEPAARSANTELSLTAKVRPFLDQRRPDCQSVEWSAEARTLVSPKATVAVVRK